MLSSFHASYFCLWFCFRCGRGTAVGGQWERHLWVHPLQIQGAKGPQRVKHKTAFSYICVWSHGFPENKIRPMCTNVLVCVAVKENNCESNFNYLFWTFFVSKLKSSTHVTHMLNYLNFVFILHGHTSLCVELNFKQVSKSCSTPI